jgi:hypothetical protein
MTNKSLPIIKYAPYDHDISEFQTLFYNACDDHPFFVLILDLTLINFKYETIMKIKPVIEYYRDKELESLDRCVIALGERNKMNRLKKKLIRAALRFFKPQIAIDVCYDMPPEKSYIKHSIDEMYFTPKIEKDD